MDSYGRQAWTWGIVTSLLATAMGALIGAAYDITHDHGNVVGLHMGFLIGAAFGIGLGAIVGVCRYDTVRNATRRYR